MRFKKILLLGINILILTNLNYSQNIQNDTIYIFSIIKKKSNGNNLSTSILINVDDITIDAKNYFFLHDIPCKVESSLEKRTDLFFRKKFVNNYIKSRIYFEYYDGKSTYLIKCCAVVADYLLVKCSLGGMKSGADFKIDLEHQIYILKTYHSYYFKLNKVVVQNLLRKIIVTSD